MRTSVCNTQTGWERGKGTKWDKGKDLGLREKGPRARGTHIQLQVNSLRECVKTLSDSQWDLRNTGREWGDEPEEAQELLEAQEPRPGRQAGRAFGQALAAVLLSSPTPAWRGLSLPGFPGSRHPPGLVSKGWSLPTPPGTELCPRA